jgi:Domain of unknown function (DUF4328)
MTTYTYKPPGGLAKGLQLLLAVTGGLTLISDAWVASVLRSGTFLLHAPDPQTGSTETAYWSGTSLPAFAQLPGTVGLATIVVWLLWQHQATANLWARGYQGLKTRPGWAVGWWFIPVAHLWMPLVTMLELDRRSTPDGSRRPASPLLGWWWAAWIGVIVPVVGFVAAALPRFADEVNRISGTRGDTVLDLSAAAHAAAPWVLITGIVYGIAAGLAILVVRRIDESQRAFAAAPFSSVPVPVRPDALA